MNMKSFRTLTIKKRSVLIGILILSAYGVLFSTVTQNKPVVIISDIISGLSVIGIAVLFFPIVSKEVKRIAYVYLILKLLEGLLMIAGGILFANESLHYVKEWIYLYPHLFTFIVSGFLFYLLLYRSKLVPLFLSIWGIVAIFVLFLKTVLELFNISHGIIDSMLALIILNEIVLALWLMIKGFRLKE